MDPMIGKSVDRYQIKSMLAEGGMGIVYHGYDPRLDREVAIKLMHPHYARQAAFQERFLQEARAAARLDHPGIVKVHDSGSQDGSLYIVMELIPGENLRVMLQNLSKNNQWILMSEAAHMVRQVSLAIHYAHRQGVLYRDVKPDNIMFKDQRCEGLPFQPVLTDLGLAKLLESLSITQDGESLGTPAYMSPEQALGNATDPRSDVYSLGVLLFELVIGRLPFQVKSIAEAIRCHTKEPPPSPRFLRPDLPATLEQVILQALQKEPDRRFPDAESMADAILEAVPVQASVPEGPVQEQTQAGGVEVSLITQYRSAITDALGPSAARAFPVPPGDLAFDRILILSTNRTSRTELVKGSVVTVGRGEDNDIVLDDQSISKNHLRIEFNGKEYTVVDLKSTNGTFQDGARLLPGISETWSIGKTLRLGDHFLKLERSSRAYARVEEQEDLGTVTQVQTMVGPECLNLLLDELHLKVEPGSEMTAHLTVINDGQVAEILQISATGIPSSWIPGLPQEMTLNPGEQQRVELLIRPPRLPETRSGNYSCIFRAASRVSSETFAEAQAVVNVKPFTQFAARLEPRLTVSEREFTFAVIIDNQGNSELNVSLEAGPALPGGDPRLTATQVDGGPDAATAVMDNPPLERGWMYKLAPIDLTIPAGEDRRAELRIVREETAADRSTIRFQVGVRPVESPEKAVLLEGRFEPAPSRTRTPAPMPQPAPQGARPQEPARIWEDDNQPGATTNTKSRLIGSWVSLLVSWIAAPFLASGIMNRTGICFPCIVDWGYSINLASYVAEQIPLVVVYAVIGLLLGLGTWISLRIAEPTLPFGQVPLLMLGWLIAREMTLLQLLVHWGPNTLLILGVITGLIGGIVTVWALGASKLKITTWQMLTIVLAWMLALGADFYLIYLGFVNYYSMLAVFINGFVIVAIAGSWTMYQIYRIQKQEPPA